MKLVKKDKLAILSSHADAFIAIRTAVVDSADGVNPEEITADTIIEALQENANEAAITQAQAQVTATQELLTASESALETANARIAELETELAGLEDFPAAASATITPKGDGGKETLTIAQFADKNKGDTEAILAQAKKEGLI